MARNKINKRNSKLFKEIITVIVLVILTFIGNNFIFVDIEKPQPIIEPQTYGDSKLEVYFFDVGQADSILLITDNKAMLVDTGNAGDARQDTKIVKGNINLTYELSRLGISTIDILVATHPHEDHMGAMYKIINAFEIGDVYANPISESEDEPNYYKRFCIALEENDIHLISPTVLTEAQIIDKINEYNSAIENEDEKIIYNSADYIRVGDIITFGDAKITILAPNSAKYSDDNDYSIVLMVEFEGVKLMLTGDAGKRSETEILEYASKNGLDLDCDILKVAHHGSRTANTEAFITAVNPEYAIIMAEKGNKYGLPDEDVIERLEAHNTVVYQTMDVGDIKLVIDDGEYEFDLTYTHQEKEE